MISTLHRFHGYGSLKYVYKNGKTVRGPILAVRYLYNSHRKRYRAAVVVSKKVHKSAVARNRIRRRIYEVLRLVDIKEPYDLVVTVFHDQVAQLTPDELRTMIHSQLKQARILDTNSRDKM